jgi:hypothetical protein
MLFSFLLSRPFKNLFVAIACLCACGCAPQSDVAALAGRLELAEAKLTKMASVVSENEDAIILGGKQRLLLLGRVMSLESANRTLTSTIEENDLRASKTQREVAELMSLLKDLSRR